MSSGVTRSFRQEIIDGIHDLDTDVIKLALYVPPANIDTLTTAYTVSNETSGSGYTAGGYIVVPNITFDQDNVLITLPIVSYPNCSFSAASALLYNSSKANRSIAAFDFGGVQTATNGTVTINWPQPATFTITG